MLPRYLACLLVSVMSTGLAGCGKPDTKAEKPLTPVRVVTASVIDYAPKAVLTGEIRAAVQNDLAFRVGGRIATREVEVGDHVTADQILARLDPQEQQANVSSAEAALAAAEAQARQAVSAFERQRSLLARGYATRRDYDQAEQDNRVAVEAVILAQSQLTTAKDQLGQTRLVAGVAGVIIARQAEIGQTVQAAQPVFTIAVDGGRDAVFQVPEVAFLNPPSDRGPIDIRLVSNPSVHASGRIREISPTIDTATGTVKVKIAVDQPPADMGLGAAVIGEASYRSGRGVVLPWTALASEGGASAVWVVDPKTQAVALRRVAIDRYMTGEFLVADGLTEGDTVVTAGSQLLFPNDKVEIRR